MEMKGSDIVVECLLEQGVDTVFGYPGGTILEIYDSLYKYQDKINHILTSHEQGASHAADGYARATGKVGVCLATSGPGATNLVTGIATAQMDSIPLVAITANQAVSLLGKDSFQEVDIAGVTMPITKHNFIVKKINDWIHGKSSLPEFRIMSQYIRNHGELSELNKLIYETDDRYKKIRDRCNDNTHYNFFKNMLLNDNEIYLKNRILYIDRLRVDLRDLFILHVSYIFFIV